MQRRCRYTLAGISPICVAACLCVSPLARAQVSETITATATVKTSHSTSATAPLTVRIDKFSTDKDRDQVMAALQKGGTDAVRTLLLTRPPLGTVIFGNTNTSVEYAYEHATHEGRILIAITSSPIAYMGEHAPGAPVKSGAYVGVVILEVKTAGAGHGELVPATKIHVDKQGSIVTDDYSDDVVHLSNVVGK